MFFAGHQVKTVKRFKIFFAFTACYDLQILLLGLLDSSLDGIFVKGAESTSGSLSSGSK